VIYLTKPQIGELVDACIAGKEHALDCWLAISPAFHRNRPLTIDEYACFQQYAEINSVPVLTSSDLIVDLRGVL
jgi:hypothetical protein